MFEEEEEDRLLIDDNEQTEVEKSKESPQDKREFINENEMNKEDFSATTTFDENRKASPEINGRCFQTSEMNTNHIGFNSSREEGELDDDEMDTSTAVTIPVKKPVEVAIS